MGRTLVVANQTLGGDELAKKVEERAEAGDSFYLVVPATGADAKGAAVLAGPVGMGAAAVEPPGEVSADTEDAYRQAQGRLRAALDRISRTGAEVDGEVGPPDPMEAINDVMSRVDGDAIIISTLRPGVSRWLGMDLVSRVRKKVDIPVDHVYAPKTPSRPISP